MNQRPSSPSVSPWRIGIGPAPTKLSQPGRKRQPFDRPPGRIGPVEHPHALAVLGRRFEHVKQRRDEGVDAAAEVLKVDQDGVERAQRLAGRAADLAVEAEYGDAVDRIGEVVATPPYCPACRRAGRAAARTPRSRLTPAAASASRLCVRSRVTEAGWASSATRLPSSGRRSSGSASSRSIPNRVMRRLIKAGARRSKRGRGNRACRRPDAPAPNRIWCRPSLRGLPTRRVPSAPRHRRRWSHPPPTR